MTSYYEAQLTARKIMQDTGLSLREVASLDLDEYARLSGRQTPAEAARAAFEAEYGQEQTAPLAAPQTAPQPPAPEPPDVPDFRAMTMQQYAEFRQAAGIGRSASARGIFDN